MNRYRGQVPLRLEGREAIIHFDFNALAALKEKWGLDGHSKLMTATAGLDLEVLVDGLVIGLERHQPGKYDAARIKAIDPPWRLVQEAVYEALEAAWYGEEGPPEENPRMRLWNRIGWWWTRLFRRGKRPSGAASHQTSSGG